MGTEPEEQVTDFPKEIPEPIAIEEEKEEDLEEVRDVVEERKSVKSLDPEEYWKVSCKVTLNIYSKMLLFSHFIIIQNTLDGPPKEDPPTEEPEPEPEIEVVPETSVEKEEEKEEEKAENEEEEKTSETETVEVNENNEEETKEDEPDELNDEQYWKVNTVSD